MCVLVHRPFGISCWNETVVLPLTYLKLSEISSIANCVLFMFCGLYLEKFYWHVIFLLRFMSLNGSKKMSDESSYYEILGIPTNATDTDIKKAYVWTEFLQLLKKVECDALLIFCKC